MHFLKQVLKIDFSGRPCYNMAKVIDVSGYSQFAEIYDRLMGDANYQKRAAFLKKIFEKYDRRPTLLLDLACGTGNFANWFAADGTEVIGVDASGEMLTIARQNAARCGTDVLFLCQEAENLDLYGTVDGAICCLDSLNHLTEYQNFCRAVERTALFLEEGRLFLFDVNTVYKHREILANNTFVWEENGIYCVWQNETEEASLITHVTLDFFAEKDGLYVRSGETFSERAYTPDEINAALQRAGLETLAVFGDLTEDPPKETEERVLYVTRKAKK